MNEGTEVDGAIDRVAIVCNAPIWEQSYPPNGFDDRYMTVVRTIVSTYPSVLVIYVRHGEQVQSAGNHRTSESFRSAVEALGDGVSFAGIDAIDTLPPSRMAIHRVKQLLANTFRRPTAQTWMREVDRALDAWQPDVVVAPAHPHWLEVSRIGLRHPMVLMVEEDFRASSDYASRTRIGGLLQRAEYAAITHSTPAPSCVVVISESEAHWAAKQFGNSRICVVPHCINDEYWRPPDYQLDRSNVFCCGHMGQLRNARGLSAITRAIVVNAAELDGAKVMIASAWPWNPEVPQPPPQVSTFLGEVDDLRFHYWSSLATLVPAFDVTGAKTTILQGWATGCPVIATTASAESVGGVDGVDLVTGDSPDAVAAAVARVLADEDLRRLLAANGFERFRAEHTVAAAAAAIRAAVDEAGRIGIVGRPPRRAQASRSR